MSSSTTVRLTPQLVWLITGTSSGLGEAMALAALKRGDKVIATARRVDKIHTLEKAGAAILALDVTDSVESLRKTADEANKIYGRVDVLVNNAGYGAITSIEEGTAEETFAQYNTNVFGALNVTRAFLPYMRARKSGKIIMIGSMGGWIGMPGMGLYTSTKYAIRGLAETLDLEITPFGLRCHYIEPGGFKTLALQNRTTYQSRIPEYNEFRLKTEDAMVAMEENFPGDPNKFAEVFLDLFREEGVASGREVPRGLAMGADSLFVIRGAIENTLKVLKDWEDVISSTDAVVAN